MGGSIYKPFQNGDLGRLNKQNEESSDFSTDALLNLDEKFPTSTFYTDKKLGGADGPGASGIPVEGTDSIFNPFYVFRFAKFANQNGKTYDTDFHRNIAVISTDGVSNTSNIYFKEQKEKIENPSASTIIEWAKSKASESNNAATLGPAPYQWSDFLWCKWYGKIPNNRLLTLRRYPIPVEDNLRIFDEKMPLIPTAQAVTWWGEGTGNSLESILGISYGFNWEPISFNGVDDVTGHEVEASAILDTIGLTEQNSPAYLRQFLLASVFSSSTNTLQSSGLDKELQEWIKNSYGSTGAYWNRVLGPVNVIENTQFRKRGFNFSNEITLTFTYKLRAYSQINPKIAFLDLISNFLNLTHNNAEFYGGAIRYFQKTGYIVPGLNTQKFELGDFVGGAKDVLIDLIRRINNKLAEFNGFVAELMEKGNLSKGNAIKALEKVGKSQLSQNIVGSWVSKLIQKPLQMRAFLDGRAVGEWHLTVGNPMDPLAVIGNLCVKTTKIKFSESLGLDDFPTEVSFVVTLAHGRDRAKQDIMSMFNLGAGSMTYTDLPLPSSAYNSFGDRNGTLMNAAYKNTAIPDTADESTKTYSAQNIKGAVTGDIQTVITDAARTGDGQFSVGKNVSLSESKALQEKYAGRIKKAYGEAFSKSNILLDYFRDLKTKD